MPSEAWIFQRPEHVKKFGTDKAPYYVGWYEPDGHRKKESCGPGFKGQKKAEALKKRIDAELMTGTYQTKTKKSWDEFQEEYERRVLAGLAARTRQEALASLQRFKEIIKAVRISAITVHHIENFIVKRRESSGMKSGSTISAATLNKDLRHLKAAFSQAVEWGYLARLPRFRMQKEERHLPTYVHPEHFAAIYQACDEMRWPDDQPYTPGDWWRALLIFAYMTGWRIGQILAIPRQDVDLDAGTVLSRAADNKGKRDQFIPLHSLAVDHLRKLASFSPLLFPWNHEPRRLFEEFNKLQKTAGIRLTGRKDHYGFHDLRRAFATMNADKLTGDALQHLMQHKDYQTTQRYINIARQMNGVVDNLFVPDLKKRPAAGG